MNSVTLFSLGLLAVLGVCVLLFASSHLAQGGAFQRMTNADDVSKSMDGRSQAYQRYLDDLPEAGWFGIGPGLFPVAYPYQTSAFHYADPVLRQYAHEDYLQTTLEWGWVGTVWWTLLVGVGLFRAFHAYAQRDRFHSRTDRHLVLAGILGVLATLAQSLFGFPLQIASIRLFFLLLLALCWASPGLLAPPERNPIRRQLLAPPRDFDADGELESP
jgi:O-antigen ligase